MSCEVGLQTKWLLLTAFDLASVAPVMLPVEVFISQICLFKHLITRGTVID